MSAADAAANSNGNKNVLANGLITFLINGKPTAINGPRNLLRNQSNCIVLENCFCIIVFSVPSRYAVKLFFVLLSDQHQVFVDYLNLLQSSHNFLRNKDNQVRIYLCNQLLDE